MFTPLLDALPASLMPTVVSYPIDRALGYAALVDVVRQCLPTDRAVAIIAESFSGPIAIRLAAESPQRISALVLAGSFVRRPLAGLSSWLAPLICSAPFRLPPPRWAIRRFLAGSDAPEELVSETIAALRLVSPRVLAGRVRDALLVDVTQDFSRCAVPVLYLSGTRDRLVSSHIPEQLRALRPELEVAYLEAPHFILQRQPRQAAKLIADFMGALP